MADAWRLARLMARSLKGDTEGPIGWSAAAPASLPPSRALP